MTDPFVGLAARVAPGATLLRHWPLRGGVSAHVDAMELAWPDGRTERLVVRRHGAIDKGHPPDIARREHRLLTALHAAGLPVPAPRHLDEHVGAPCLVMAFVEGSTELAADAVPDAVRQMAVFLAGLHALDPAALTFLPRRERPDLLPYLPDTPMGAGIRAALAGRDSSSRNAPALLHGDFWPGNVLWRDGRLLSSGRRRRRFDAPAAVLEIAAVLDWEDAAVGDPLADLAGCRLELLWKHGEEVMAAFTREYVARSPVDRSDLPLWELYVALAATAHLSEWGLPAETEAAMRRKAEGFVEAAWTTLRDRPRSGR